MTEEQAAGPLAPRAIYRHIGRTMIAKDESVLSLFMGTDPTEFRPNEATEVIALPNTDAWADAMLDYRNRMRQDLTNERNELRGTLEYVNNLKQAILEKAEKHEWCEEYDEFAEEWDLPQREHEYDVTISVRVRARDEEKAEDLVLGTMRFGHHDAVVDGPTASVEKAYY